MPSPATTRRSKLDFAARTLHPTQVRMGFFPVSGSSVRAVIALLVYRLARKWYAARYGARRRPLVTAEPSSAFDSPSHPRCGGVYRSAASAALVSDVAVRGAGADALTAPSERMSIRQPVSRAASRAFCPSLPIARESW